MALVCLCRVAWADTALDLAALSRPNAAPAARDYPSDDAVWLLRNMDITIAPSGATVVRERKVLKLLTAQALPLAQWEIPYDRSCEQLTIVAARTWRDGHATPVDPAQIVDSAVYPGAGWYDSLMVRRFPLPGAAAGSILEVETVFRRPAPRISGAFSARLQLQDILPTREANYTLHAPLAHPLAIRFVGQTPKLAMSEGNGQRVYRWTVRALPGLHITEAQTPPVDDLIASARITSLTGWAPVAAWYHQLTAGKDAATDALRQAVASHTAGCATVAEKIAALHRFVREIPCVGLEMGNLSDEPHSADAVLRQNAGDCKDKATLLRALLRIAGIPSDYVLVRTTDHGRLDRQLYGPADFNHVILVAQTPEGDRYLDATMADAPADCLPAGVEGADALIVRGQGALTTLPVSTAAQNCTDIRVATALLADGSATGHATLTFTGQTAIAQRGILAAIPSDRYREALEGALAPCLGSDIALSKVTVAHLHDAGQPLVITLEFASPAFIQPAGDQYSGALPAFMYQANRYRTVATRKYPFSQRLESSLHLESVITLPTGFTVASLPPPVVYDGPRGLYRDAAQSDDGTIRDTCDLATKRGLFPPDALTDAKHWASILALEGRNNLQFFLRHP